MRTANYKINLIALSILAFGVVGFLPTRMQAEPSPDLMNSIMLQSREQAAKVPQGETIAMVCAKCKTVLLSPVDKKKSFLFWFNPKTKHECLGCGGEFHMRDVPSGQGSAVSVNEYVHTCSKCGDDSAFCCATKSGSGPTKGMEKQKK